MRLKFTVRWTDSELLLVSKYTQTLCIWPPIELPITPYHIVTNLQGSLRLVGWEPFWDFECPVAQCLHTPLTEEAPPKCEEDLGCRSIWWAHNGRLPPSFENDPPNRFVLWVRQAPPLQELPSPCLQLFCSHAFWTAWDSQGDLWIRQILHTYSWRVT